MNLPPTRGRLSANRFRHSYRTPCLNVRYDFFSLYKLHTAFRWFANATSYSTRLPDILDKALRYVRVRYDL